MMIEKEKSYTPTFQIFFLGVEGLGRRSSRGGRNRLQTKPAPVGAADPEALGRANTHTHTHKTEGELDLKTRTRTSEYGGKDAWSVGKEGRRG